MKKVLSKGEATKQKILQAAILLFAKDGYGPASFQAIADKCGLAQTTVLFHFPSKERLIEACIQKVILNNHAIVSAGLSKIDDDDPLAQLKAHFELNLEWAIQYPAEVQLILLLYYLAAQNESFCETYRKVRSSASKRIEEYLLAAGRKKILKTDVDPIQSGLTLHDMLLGSILNFMATRQKKTELKKTHRQWETVFSSLLYK